MEILVRGVKVNTDTLMDWYATQMAVYPIRDLKNDQIHPVVVRKAEAIKRDLPTPTTQEIEQDWCY